jgi:hypothetical protein
MSPSIGVWDGAAMRLFRDKMGVRLPTLVMDACKVRRMSRTVLFFCFLVIPLMAHADAAAATAHDDLLTNVGLCIGVAAALAILASKCRQPSLLAYLASRFVTIFLLLHSMGYGHRGSLLPAINLSQISEFSIIIGSLGVAFGHVDTQLVSLLIVVFAFTSIVSTYMVEYSHPLYQRISRALSALHLADLDVADATFAGHHEERGRRIVFLGFFREASSVLHEFELQGGTASPHPLLKEMLIIDFNPDVHAELRRRGIACLYGDIAHMATLHHAEIHRAELIISTIPDAILKGTTNARLLEEVQRLNPHAKLIVTAESAPKALSLYQQGADFVFIPRLHSASHLAKVI